ncbi:hypothetical protein DPMN_008675 [Dreissena polymorpha]|uniref:Uncharacterized protein n=1 Tax=Dreissena polymorpha TaxID=45954 RepID=A0A9D4MZS1_DREPO|nr:hypothetical protein DPMN_008675 [Dreissena polymorpha]
MCEFLSFDGVPNTIIPLTTLYPHEPTWTNTEEIRILEKRGPSRHLHGPSRTYTTATDINTAAIRKNTICPGPTIFYIKAG